MTARLRHCRGLRSRLHALLFFQYMPRTCALTRLAKCTEYGNSRMAVGDYHNVGPLMHRTTRKPMICHMCKDIVC